MAETSETGSAKKLLWFVGGIFGTILVGLSQEFIERAFEEWGLFNSPSKQLEALWSFAAFVLGSIGAFLGSLWFLLPAAFAAGFLVCLYLSQLATGSSNPNDEPNKLQAIYDLRNIISSEIYKLENVLGRGGFDSIENKVNSHYPSFKSFILTVKKSGLTTPNFSAYNELELRFALAWLELIHPLIEAGHIEEAEQESVKYSRFIDSEIAKSKS